MIAPATGAVEVRMTGLKSAESRTQVGTGDPEKT